jgi:hypothetical protein
MDNVLPSPIFQAAPQYQYPKSLSSGLSVRGMTLVSDNCRNQVLALVDPVVSVMGMLQQQTRDRTVWLWR